MCACTRRAFVFGAAATAAFAPPARAATTEDFIDAAFSMREQAIDAGEAPYGAVVVRAGVIVGRGAARIRDRGFLGHAERMAMREAQERFGGEDLADCVIYSTSRPCESCRRAAAHAKISRMYFGIDGADGGKP